MSSKYLEVSAHGDMLRLQVRGITNRSTMIYTGLTKTLQEQTEFRSPFTDSMIENFAALISRTVSLESKTDMLDEIGNDWLTVWTLYNERQYEEAFNLFSEWTGTDDIDLMLMWDTAISSANFEIVLNDPDLVSPDNLKVPVGDDELKKKLPESA